MLLSGRSLRLHPSRFAIFAFLYSSLVPHFRWRFPQIACALRTPLEKRGGIRSAWRTHAFGNFEFSLSICDRIPIRSALWSQGTIFYLNS